MLESLTTLLGHHLVAASRWWTPESGQHKQGDDPSSLTSAHLYPRRGYTSSSLEDLQEGTPNLSSVMVFTSITENNARIIKTLSCQCPLSIQGNAAVLGTFYCLGK